MKFDYSTTPLIISLVIGVIVIIYGFVKCNKIEFGNYKLRAENKQAEVLKDETELLEFAFEQCDADLVYMYAYGSWYVYDNAIGIGNCSYQFIELEEALYVPL